MTEEANSKKRPAGVWIGGGAVVVLLLLAGLVWFDPFGLNLRDRFREDFDLTITAVPTDSRAYVGLNLLDLDLDRIDELAAAFATDADSAASFDAQLMQALGLSFTADIQPWIGQYIGFALLDLNVNRANELTALEWLLVIEARDTGGADAFLDKLATNWAARTGATAVSETVQGVPATTFTSPSLTDRLALARSERLVLIGSSAAAIETAIQTRQGESLAADPAYQETVAALPPARMATGYIDGALLNDLVANSQLNFSNFRPQNLPTAAIEGTAIGLSLAEMGILLDFVTQFDAEKLSPAQQAGLATQLTNPQFPGLLPQNVPVYISGQGLDHLWGMYRDAFSADLSAADFAASMATFARQFGINPEEQLFPLLDGETAVALIPEVGSQLPTLSAMGTGLVLLAQTSDQMQLNNNVAAFADSIGDATMGLGQITPSHAAGYTLYQFDSVLLQGIQPLFGVGNGRLIVGDSPQAAETVLLHGGNRLADDALHRQTWAAFTPGLAPNVYVNVNALYPILVASGVWDMQTVAWLQPLQTVALAGRSEATRAFHQLQITIADAQ